MTVANIPAFSEPVTVVEGVDTYTFDYNVELATEVQVQVTDNGVVSYLTYGDDYTVVKADAPAVGGTITVTAELTVGAEVVSFRQTGLAQDTRLPNQGPYFAKTVEEALDRITMLAQEAARDSALALQYPVGSTAITLFPAPVENKAVVGRMVSGALQYVADGPSLDELNTSVSAAAASAAAASTSETNAATSESNAADSETNAATSESNAADSETNAATSESNAADSETNAAASAAAAAASATSADADEVSAATSASNAATSETNAATSETNAAAALVATQAARDATLAAFDSFDDRYLGAKAADPLTDNDGDPLAAGMLYFDTVNGVMKLYNGSTWVSAYVSGADYLLLAGGTMTGFLTLHADPTAAAHAATKQYVDNSIATRAASAHQHAAGDITSGVLVHERGGLEADVSAFDGVPKISGGSTTELGVGTSANNLVQLNGSGELPAISGANLTNLPGGAFTEIGSGFTVSGGVISITGISADAKEVLLISTDIVAGSNSTSSIRLGGGSGLVTSGYDSSRATTSFVSFASTFFSTARELALVLQKGEGDEWLLSGDGSSNMFAGSVDVGEDLTQIELDASGTSLTSGTVRAFERT